jgi:hypothetical protein
MIKKIILIMILLISIVFILGFLDNYRIINNNYILKQRINKTMNEQKYVEYSDKSVVIRDKLELDNRLIVYFTYNKNNDGGWWQ